MRYKVDHDLHIHSGLSLCSGRADQNKERIMQYAKNSGLNTICITDHYWDSDLYTWNKFYIDQPFDHIARILPLPQDENVKFLFGCETDMDVAGTVGAPPKRYDDFAFIIVPTTHMHMGTFVLTEEENNDPGSLGRAKAWVRRFDDLLATDMPFHKVGLAHPACTLIDNRSRKQWLEVLDAIPEAEMERLFAKAAEVGMGIELNRDDMMFTDEEEDTVLRMFKIAKYQGCKFYLGSDAHTPKWLEGSVPVFERAIDRLGLEERDKFILQ